MTEAEWLACRNPYTLLVWVRRLATIRRYRLFNIACCRRIESLLKVTADQACLKAMEAYAEGTGTDPTVVVEGVLQNAQSARQGAFPYGRSQAFGKRLREFLAAEGRVKALGAVAACARMRCEACWESLVAYRYTQVWETRAGRRAANKERQKERTGRASLARDIFGNPFRPIIFSPAWRAGTAISLARAMHESGDFSAMPILADALQDADCDNDDILNHCRNAEQSMFVDVGSWILCWATKAGQGSFGGRCLITN